jgi:hypothetical protein
MHVRACTLPHAPAHALMHAQPHTQICNIYCFSTATMIRETASLLRYTYIVYLVIFLWALLYVPPFLYDESSILSEACSLRSLLLWNISQHSVASCRISHNISLITLSWSTLNLNNNVIFMLLHLFVWRFACLMFAVTIQWSDGMVIWY